MKKRVIIAEACLGQKFFFLFNFQTKKLNIFPYLLPIFCCRFLMGSFVCIGPLPLISLNVELLDLNVWLPFPSQSKGHWSLLKKGPTKIHGMKSKKYVSAGRIIERTLQWSKYPRWRKNRSRRLYLSVRKTARERDGADPWIFLLISS